MQQLLKTVFLFLLLGTASAQGKPTLEFSVEVTPVVYSVSENLTVKITLKNVGAKPYHVYQDLDYFITSFARTEAGENIARGVIEQTLPPPPERDSFVVLRPGQKIEHTRKLSLTDLGISKPGKYQVDFHYRSTSGRPFGFLVWRGFLNTSSKLEVAAATTAHQP